MNFLNRVKKWGEVLKKNKYISRYLGKAGQIASVVGFDNIANNLTKAGNFADQQLGLGRRRARGRRVLVQKIERVPVQIVTETKLHRGKAGRRIKRVGLVPVIRKRVVRRQLGRGDDETGIETYKKRSQAGKGRRKNKK